MSGYDRFQEPAQEPLSPKRAGRFIIENVSFGTKDGYPIFYAHPETGPLHVQLAVDYEIEAGETNPVIHKWHWRDGDLDLWKEIECSDIENAADELLEKEMYASFERWAAENSETVIPPQGNYFSGFMGV